MKKHQDGIALITALIITSIALSLAGTILYRQQIQIRLSGNIAHLEQAYVYANGLEDWAGTILNRSINDHPNYVSLDDDWAAGGYKVSLPIDGGLMEGQLFDLQARINLNTLLIPHPPKPPRPKAGQPPKKPKPDIAAINRQRINELIRLIDPDQEIGPPESVSDIIKDWIDKDDINGNETEALNSASGGGAESPYYQSLTPPYYSANTQLVSPSELLLLKDMKKKIYEKMRPFVSTLPIKPQTPINVNTAEITVLQAIGFDTGSAEAIKKERENRPFRSKKEFTDYIKNNTDISFIPSHFDQDIDTKSRFFLLKGEVTINQARVFINSVLERKNNRFSVIMRDFSNPE